VNGPASIRPCFNGRGIEFSIASRPARDLSFEINRLRFTSGRGAVVHFRAVALSPSQFVLNWRPMSGTSGSFGLASFTSEQIESGTLLIVSAGAHLPLRMSRQITPFSSCPDGRHGLEHDVRQIGAKMPLSYRVSTGAIWCQSWHSGLPGNSHAGRERSSECLSAPSTRSDCDPIEMATGGLLGNYRRFRILPGSVF
jgi:hypothetical protein